MNFQRGDYVRLTKLAPVGSPDYPTPTWDQYHRGERTHHSLPTDYQVTGILLSGPLTEGNGCFVARDSENGVKCGGRLRTSYIQAIEESIVNSTIFHTWNSMYRLEKLPPLDHSEAGESEWVN